MGQFQPFGGWRMLLSVSRWRFWPYLAGTYLVGYAVGMDGAQELLSWTFWAHLAYFTLPANLLLYGINDLCDADTDARNPKKGSKEHLLARAERRPLGRAVTAALALTILIAAIERSWNERLWLAAFVALAFLYSAAPFRLKARPFLDSASNVLYAVPGFLGFVQASGGGVQPASVLTAGLWTAAMHLYSAIPDIESDKATGLSTTATVLGFRTSLALCAALWLAFAVVVSSLPAFRPWSFALFVYPAIPSVLAWLDADATRKFYWSFPIINGLIGMGAFFVVALSR